MKIRERDLGQVISALSEFPECIGKELPKKQYGYLLCGQHFLPIRGIGLVRWLLQNLIRPRHWPRAYVRLPFLADLIRVKNNLRLFGYGEYKNLSVKLALAGIRRRGSLRREIKVRRLFSGAFQPSFRIPSIDRYDKKNGRWIIEDMVVRHKNGRPPAEEFIQDHALDFYRSTCKFHKVSDRRVYGLFASEVTSHLSNNEVNVDLHQVLNANWPFALCHGDLSPGNMMRNRQGELFIVDWETAGVMPVAADLKKLYANQPALRSEILHTIGMLSAGKPNVVPPEIQMAIVLILDSAFQKRNEKKMIQYYRKARGMSVKRTHQHIFQEKERNETLILELFKNANG